MTHRKLAHFELQDLLGEGAMGRVYRAVDLELDRPVAIKLLSGRTLGDASFLDRFRREARLAAQLNHPHIATIYAFGVDEGEAYIAMEFVEGETLADVLARGPLPIALVRKYGGQAASALAVAHAKGIIHRDIKPGNLMITGSGDLKVMDFGVARRSGETELTMAGSLIGTANIMAPELVQGGEVTPAADLFSLGCVLYEMLTGRPAFDGETAMAVLFQVVNQEPVALESLRPETPDDLRDLVYGLLSKDPLTRLGPASVVAERITLTAGDTSATGTMVLPGAQVGTMVLKPGEAPVPGTGNVEGPDAAGKAKPPSLLRRFWWVGAVLLVLGAGAVWMLGRGGGGARDAAEAKNRAGEALVEQFGTNPDSLSRALEFFGEATALDSTYAPAWNNLGLLHRSLGDLVRAEGELRNAARLDAAYAVPRYNLGQIYRDQRRWSDAESRFREAIALDPRYAEAEWGLARLQEERADLPDTAAAVAGYRRAIEANAGFYRAHNDLGYLWLEAGEPESALAVLRPAVERFDTIPALWKNLGEAYRAAGSLDEAEAAYTRALTLDPSYGAAAAGMAEVAEARGDVEGARDLWSRLAGSGDPGLAERARAALARLGR